MHILVTAGGTREHIDPVRFISNASSGKMGYALARVALRRRHTVTLITAPTHLEPPGQANVIPVVSARDMFEAVQREIAACDCLMMAAAVSDYTVAQPFPTKLKKSSAVLTLPLEPTQDILQWVAETRRQKAACHGAAGKPKTRNPIVVGFALEDRDVRAYAEDKLQRKNLDMIVANRPEAIGADLSAIQIKCSGRDWIEYGPASKDTQAQRILKLIESLDINKS